MWTLHTDSGNNVYGGQSAKNIYLGETRIVTKLNSGTNPTYQEEYYKQYFYHSDHLGSASLISDYNGDEYQRIEYTPYGETWVEKTQNTGSEFLPYKFTAKELDEETGLYYYGARYLDPKYSMWISTDPALGEYIPKAPIDEEAKKYNQNLPGMGGVFNHINGNLYHYAGNNPVKYTDPDGKELYINGDESYKNKVLEDIKKLAPNAVMDTNGKVILQGSPTKGYEIGTSLVASLAEDNGKNVTIRKPTVSESILKGNSDWSTADDPVLAQISGAGCGSNIYYNPDLPYKTDNIVDGRLKKEKVDKYVALGHEMIHSYSYSRGIAKLYYFDSYTNLLGRKINRHIKCDELFTVGLDGYGGMFTENALRAEHKINLRGQY